MCVCVHIKHTLLFIETPHAISLSISLSPLSPSLTNSGLLKVLVVRQLGLGAGVTTRLALANHKHSLLELAFHLTRAKKHLTR